MILFIYKTKDPSSDDHDEIEETKNITYNSTACNSLTNSSLAEKTHSCSNHN
jgi:hypothetical protein